MLWTVRHLWYNGARFAFNCYRHQSLLIMRRPGGTAEILLSREGVTQGDPLSMVLYGVTLVPLAKLTRLSVNSLVHAWYADDAALAGPLSAINQATELIVAHGPARGYYMEPDKSVLICSPTLPESALTALRHHNFTRSDGTRYLGGFIGLANRRAEWLRPQIEEWTEGVRRLARVARRFPQTAFAGLSKSLQAEWQYALRVLGCAVKGGLISEGMLCFKSCSSQGNNSAWSQACAIRKFLFGFK